MIFRLLYSKCIYAHLKVIVIIKPAVFYEVLITSCNPEHKVGLSQFYFLPWKHPWSIRCKRTRWPCGLWCSCPRRRGSRQRSLHPTSGCPKPRLCCSGSCSTSNNNVRSASLQFLLYDIFFRKNSFFVFLVSFLFWFWKRFVGLECNWRSVVVVTGRRCCGYSVFFVGRNEVLLCPCLPRWEKNVQLL